MESSWIGKENLKKPDSRNYFWSQSGASLRERVKEPEEKRPADRERGERGLRSLENAYGSISFGVDRDEKISVSVERRTPAREPGLRNDQKKLDEGHQAPVYVGGAQGFTDSHHKEDSALVWKEKITVSPERIMEELKRLAAMTRQETLEDMIPSLLPEQYQEDRQFHYNLLKKVKKQLTEALKEAREQKEEGETEELIKLPLFGKSMDSSGEEDDEQDMGGEENEESDLPEESL